MYLVFQNYSETLGTVQTVCTGLKFELKNNLKFQELPVFCVPSVFEVFHVSRTVPKRIPIRIQFRR